jgi:uncharacterized membrane protein
MTFYIVKRFMKPIRNNVITGFFILIPVVGSIFIVWKLFDWADKALPKMLGVHWPPFVGLCVSIIIVYLVGLAAKNYFGRKIIAIGNSIIVSIPLLNKIYLVIKQVIDTVTVDKKKMFERVVLVEFPKPGNFVVGFVTSESNEMFSAKTEKKLVAVFVPTAPVPSQGVLVYVAEEELITLDMPVESALKLIVSVGLLGTEKTGSMQKFSLAGEHWNWMDIFKRKSSKAAPRNLNDPRD